MTTMTSIPWKPSDAQVEFATKLFKEKFTDTPEARQFWDNLKSVSTNEGLTTFLDALKAMPSVRPLPNPPGRQFLLGNGDVQPRPQPLPKRTDVASEPGLYRNPADGTLYRIGKRANSWTTPTVSVYSNKATVRRLTPEGRMVKKGKWNRLNAYTSRQMLSTHPLVAGDRVLAAWYMTDEDKLEWAVGFCMFCSRGLIDAVSVFNNIGPDCAEDRGIVRQVPPEV